MGTAPGARIGGEQRERGTFFCWQKRLRGASLSYRLLNKSPFPQILFSSRGLLCFLPCYYWIHHSWFQLEARHGCLRMRGGKKGVPAGILQVCPHVYSLLTVFHVDFFWEKSKQVPKTKTNEPNHQNWKTVSLSLCSPWPCHDEFSYWFFVPFYIFGKQHA